MTRYLLHGGNTSDDNAINNKFFKMIADPVPKNGLIILNYFARVPTEVKKCFNQDKEAIVNASKRKDIRFEIADIKKQEEQIKECDVLYLRGGWTQWLVKGLGKIKGLENLLKGKTVAGSSAGVYVLSKHYCGNTKNKLEDGLGILNLKTRCHYTKMDDKKVIPKLLEHGSKVPVLTIPDYETVVFYK